MDVCFHHLVRVNVHNGKVEETAIATERTSPVGELPERNAVAYPLAFHKQQRPVIGAAIIVVPPLPRIRHKL
jgi:hypothetical protein